MKKNIYIISGVLVVCITALCCYFAFKYFTKDENSKEWTLESFPRVDASTATQPLMNAFISNYTNTPIKDINVEYTHTHSAYVKLIEDKVDLIIVTEPSKEELDYALKNGVELDVIPVSNEAFVFFVNKTNSVENLSIKEIQNIYSGKTKNWKDVGGPSAKIVPYQRPENSGSQTGMLSLVMKDVKIDNAVSFEIETMSGIIEQVVSYDTDDEKAIGYSYYYFANTMYPNDNIKYVSIDNVKPTYESIKTKKYPLMSAYYIVVNKNLKDGSDTKKLVEKMLSKGGQRIVKEAGYVEIN